MNSVDLTDTNRTDNRQLRKVKSPIAVFILKEDGHLAVVAIQEDPNNGQEISLIWFFLSAVKLLRTSFKLSSHLSL